MKEEVVIISYARTPFGAFQGSLSSLPAPKLGAHAIEAALKRSGLSPDSVSEVIMGNVLSAGTGQAPARQAALGAAIPSSTPCLTINKVCGSGMKAIMLGSQSIRLGESRVVVAGGMENMSQAPYLSKEARAGFRMGHQRIIDSMVHDGLWDPYNNQHMGNCGELCAKEQKITREEQDQFAIESFHKGQRAQADGKLSPQIAPIEIKDRKGRSTLIDCDESLAKGQPDKIPNLKPAFEKNGTVTAANASSINDGAAALVLADRGYAEEMGLNPVARIVSYATHSQEPAAFTTAPAPAMTKALQKAGWELDSVDLFEVNEAFAVVALAAQKQLNIPIEKLNVWGGAVSIGHPIGASGARIVMTLIAALKHRGLKRGIASICIGGGEATALCVEVL